MLSNMLIGGFFDGFSYILLMLNKVDDINPMLLESDKV